MDDIKVTGLQLFMGKEIPVVHGGFGKDKKCICDKTIAELHNMNNFDVRRRISDNIKRFEENVDLIDLLNVMHETHNNLLQALGYTKMQIAKAEHIYLLSQRGYLKLVKIMDSDQAWDIYNQVLDEYFMMKEEKEEQEKKLPTSYKEALQQLIIEIEEKEKLEAEKLNLQAKIEEDRPKVVLADAIAVSDTCILIRNFVKILRQNGIDTGEKRFFKWLRENGYLMKSGGVDWNTPTQKAMNLKLFEVRETAACTGHGVKISFTTYVTTKGQMYFIDKLLNKSKGQLQLSL